MRNFPNGNYPVNDMYASIQGEGAQVGVPMIILRLHGCPVGCGFCDTKETWDFDAESSPDLESALGKSNQWISMNAWQIGNEISSRFGKSIKWILLTGGEPALYDLKPLIDNLHNHGYKVAIETSGTACGHLDAGIDWVCVSPKVGMPGQQTMKPHAVASADEIKWVIGKQAHLDACQAFIDNYDIPDNIVSIQPMSQSERATELCVKTAIKKGWRLSIQAHKYLNLD